MSLISCRKGVLTHGFGAQCLTSFWKCWIWVFWPTLGGKLRFSCVFLCFLDANLSVFVSQLSHSSCLAGKSSFWMTPRYAQFILKHSIYFRAQSGIVNKQWMPLGWRNCAKTWHTGLIRKSLMCGKLRGRRRVKFLPDYWYTQISVPQ